VARAYSPPRFSVTDLFEDFRDLLLELDRGGVEFVIVGGYAVSYYGHPRATKDLDVFICPGKANAERVMQALERFGAPLAQLGIVEADFVAPGTVVQLGVPPVRIDLITELSGITFAEAYEEHGALTVHGRTIPVIGRQALLRNKRASGRAQDLADVEALT
jgi:hypothetical protein